VVEWAWKAWKHFALQEEKAPMKTSLFAALVVIALIAIAGQSATAEAPSTRPALSGTLNLLCPPQIARCKGMKAEFQKVYPRVTVKFVRLSSGEALTRLRNEKANPHFDLWWGRPIDSFIAARAEGLLDSYNSPNLANLLDPRLMQDPENYWAGIYAGSLGFASNKRFLEPHNLQPPASWADLFNPAFKGQLVMGHPSSSGTAYTALITVLQLQGEAKGCDYWKQFNANVWQYTKSGAAPAQHVGQGEAAVGVVFSHDIVTQMEQGLPIVLSFAQEGMGWEIGGMAMVKGARHPDLARAWFDWALEPATQELGPRPPPLRPSPPRGDREPRAREALLGAKAPGQALADAVGVSKATIFRIEKGDFTDVKGQTVAHLARVLNVSADYLLGLKEEPEPLEKVEQGA
jgi:iron(III) transport system substrate-binding protein